MSTRHIPVYFLKLYHDEINRIRSKMERDGAIILRHRASKRPARRFKDLDG